MSQLKGPGLLGAVIVLAGQHPNKWIHFVMEKEAGTGIAGHKAGGGQRWILVAMSLDVRQRMSCNSSRLGWYCSEQAAAS